MSTVAPISIFISYAREDELLCQDLKKHLQAMRRQQLIQVWSNGDISAGADRKQVVNSYLNTADIILLLISPDFLASDDCYNKEANRALERHERGEAHVIAILLRSVDLFGTSIQSLPCFPSNGIPVTGWTNPDEAFSDIAKGIREAVQRKCTSSSAWTPLMEPLVARYRTALHGDARIAHLQVLGMSRSLEVMNIYVRVRVQEPRELGYAPDPTVLAAERQRDPNMVMMMHRQWHDNASGEILSPEEAIGKYKHCVLIGDPAQISDSPSGGWKTP